MGLSPDELFHGQSAIWCQPPGAIYTQTRTFSCKAAARSAASADARVVSTVMSHVLPVQWSWVRRDTQRQHSEATLTGNTQRQYSEAIIKGNPQQYCLLETRIELHWKHYS